jgi:hypothetical protein
MQVQWYEWKIPSATVIWEINYVFYRGKNLSASIPCYGDRGLESTSLRNITSYACGARSVSIEFAMFHPGRRKALPRRRLNRIGGPVPILRQALEPASGDFGRDATAGPAASRFL